MRIECAPGSHTITFEYRNSTGSTISSKSLVVTVISGRETTISGNIEKGEITSGGSGGPTSEVQAIEVKKETEVEVKSSVVPASTSTSETKTTVTFPAGSFNADSANAVLNLSVKSAGEITVTSTEVPAVAGIDISLKVNNQEVNSFNGKEVVIETYIDKNLTNVIVRYNGDGDQPIATDENVEDRSKAKVLDTDEGSSLGYNPNTGLLRFKTNHFSEYYVLANVEAINVSTGIPYTKLVTAINSAQDNSTIKLLANVITPTITYYIENKNLTLDLNGKTLSGSGYDGTLCVGSNATLTINGEGNVIGNDDREYGMAIWASDLNANVIINGGSYSNTLTHTDEQMDMIYASDGGKVVINGGVFECITPKWTLNVRDIDYKSGASSITVYGGKFYKYDPSHADTENPVANFVVEGKKIIQEEGDWYRVVELKQGVTISGIAGVAASYDTIQEAYEAVKAMLVANSGLAEQQLSEEAFNAFFTDGGKITWKIYGNQEVTDTRMFSFGRAANRFGEGRHITEINIVGGNSSASLDLSAVNGTFDLPYNWWDVADSVNTTLKCSNITFNGIKSMPTATYQCPRYSTIYEFDECKFNGNLYSYQNFNVNMTIKNCTFNAPANTQYAFFAQGAGGKITLDNNVFNNYTRGINLQRATADFIVTDNTIVSTVSEPDRGAIQLTDGKSFVVTGNKVDVNAGNAFWFHDAATNDGVTYTISNNDIKAPYIGYSGVTAFDVNTKITSSGNTFNSTDTANCMKKGATVAEATNLTAIL